MDNPSLIITLALATLFIVLGYGVYQWTRVRQSQARRHETPGGIAGPSDDHAA